MKSLKPFSVALMGFVVSIFLSACESNPDLEPQQDILPETMTVDIPASLSYTEDDSGGRTSGRTKEDTLKGNAIYQHLGTFIAIGKASIGRSVPPSLCRRHANTVS